MSDRAAEGEELRAIARRLARGDLEALASLFDLLGASLYRQALWHLGRPADAEDVVQDVLTAFSQRGARLEAIVEPAPYLRRMIHRACQDLARARARRREEAIDACLLLPARESGAAAASVDLERALAALPAEQREAVYLHTYLGLSFRELGEVQGVPTQTAASRHRLALERLRQELTR